MATLKEQILNGKFNWKLYPSNTIYVNYQKIEGVNLEELLSILIETFLQKGNIGDFLTLSSYVKIDEVTPKTFDQKKREISLCWNWRYEAKAQDFASLEDFFKSEIENC